MKTLLLFLFLVLPIISFSQSNFYKINRFSFLNYMNGEWVLEETIEPKDQFLVINGKKIILTSEELNLSYLIYGEKTVSEFKTHIATHWSAIDNTGKNCYVMIKSFLGEKEKSVNFMYIENSHLIELIVEEE